jgi:1,4-dihydroxy-2-naphthoate octaprenyltransferase
MQADIPHSRLGSLGLLGKAVSAVRYRFFLFAGLLPYLLGAAWAHGQAHAFNPGRFALGLIGVFFAIVGVECFNEYFDSRLGTDRVFNPNDEPPISDFVFWAGCAGFAASGVCGAVLMVQGGWPVAACAFVGGMAAVFYVGPPFRWAYLGLGETVIGLSYGPAMTLGSMLLHTHDIGPGALIVSFVPGLLVMCLAVVNNIPDFHQDRLVGKRTLVVRNGRRGGVVIYGALASLALTLGIAGALAGVLPRAAALIAVAIPLVITGIRRGLVTHENPRAFIPAVRSMVTTYLLATVILVAVVA